MLEVTRKESEFMLCNKNFRTDRGLIQHLNTCRRKQVQSALQHSSINDTLNDEIQDLKKYIDGTKWEWW